MDVSYLWPSLKLGLTLILDMLLILVILTGIRIRQSRQTNRLLKSIDASLKMLPGVERTLRRAG